MYCKTWVEQVRACIANLSFAKLWRSCCRKLGLIKRRLWGAKPHHQFCNNFIQYTKPPLATSVSINPPFAEPIPPTVVTPCGWWWHLGVGVRTPPHSLSLSLSHGVERHIITCQCQRFIHKTDCLAQSCKVAHIYGALMLPHHSTDHDMCVEGSNTCKASQNMNKWPVLHPPPITTFNQFALKYIYFECKTSQKYKIHSSFIIDFIHACRGRDFRFSFRLAASRNFGISVRLTENMVYRLNSGHLRVTTSQEKS